VNDETRGATDKICRTARSIVQAASDVENYVLKRFPLTLTPDYEASEIGVVQHIIRPQPGAAHAQQGGECHAITCNSAAA
jgi:hypothetical protein